MTGTVNFVVGSKSEGIRALEQIQGAFPSRRVDTASAEGVHRDTFEWLLYREGTCFHTSRTAGAVTICWSDLDATPRRRLGMASVPEFAVDLPEGPLRRDLEPLIAVRRLLPVVVCRIRSRGLCILDQREKIVARVELRHGTARAPGKTAGPRRTLPVTLSVLPLKGYSAAAGRVTRFVEKEIGLARSKESDLEMRLRTIGREPADIPDGQKYPIDRKMRTDVAVKAILRALLQTLQRNLKGVRHQLDTEFLHDARVAVRRQRSVISQVPGIFDLRTTDRLKRDLAWLGQLTGTARDLDVHLIEMSESAKLVPFDVRDGLDPLCAMLERMRRTEQKKIVAGYDSVRFSRLIRYLEAFLARPVPTRTRLGNAGLPVTDVARKRIRKAYRRLVRRGAKIDDDSPPEHLHRLRIDAKKLRYLLEFFAGLFPRGEVKKLVRALKDLQDNLGLFNDLSIQQETLRSLAGQIGGEDPSTGDAVRRAVEPLVERLAERQLEERGDFAERFAAFTHRNVRARFDRVFGESKATKS